jgi:4-hydroxybenzoyl-CoA reductase subunit gamma
MGCRILVLKRRYPRPLARILELTLNGRPRVDAVPDNLLLLDYLREVVGLTGTKQAVTAASAAPAPCSSMTSRVCHASRLRPAFGQRVDTDRIARRGRHLSQCNAFSQKLGAQCGYCTPGFIMASAGLLRRNPAPERGRHRSALGGNICRCTGYVKIIEAVKYAAELNAAGVAP